MDSYSGSEPRLFISFRLGNESNGQPPKRGADEEKPESSDSFVTAASNTENQIVTVADVCCHGIDNLEPDSSAQTTMSAPAQGEMEVVPEDAHRENEPRSGLGLVPEVPVVLSTTAITPPTLRLKLYMLKAVALTKVAEPTLLENGSNWGASQKLGPVVKTAAKL